MNSRFVIAAASSGSGKTTLTLGLLRSLRRRNLSVSPFKCGPDYIDPMWHKAASGSDSINLDTFLASEAHVRQLFARYASGSDVCVVEGVMGMFDGYDKMSGSSADISRLLDIPVVLLVNAASTAYSVAATIFGFKNFRPDIKIAGVIFNRVASRRHFSFLKDACHDAGVECFGYIGRIFDMEMPSRYLGLSIESQHSMNVFVDKAADAVASGVDIDALLAATQIDTTPYVPDFASTSKTHFKVAVASDEAFNFIYPANILALREHPCYDISVEYFSPLRDSVMPQCDMLYLPGGYPELYAAELSANSAMIDSVRTYAENGGKILAECGGMMYLMRGVDDYPMCGVLPMDVTMHSPKLTLGYRSLMIDGEIWRGHEFHYSRVLNPDELPSIAVQRNAKGKEVPTPLYRYKNVIAGYTHLYWGDKDILRLWQI